MTDLETPEHCPGPQSENAGKSSACDTCPARDLCASGAFNKPDLDIPQIRERLSTIRHKILVLSGKGGVGKSTVTALLAKSLSTTPNPGLEDMEGNYKVGLMDIDLCGPSMPILMNMEEETIAPHTSGLGKDPQYLSDDLSIMSVGFLANESDAMIWRGNTRSEMIKRFLRDVNWDELDYLVVDTPPGTSDEHLTIVKYLKEGSDDGTLSCVLVTTPQEVALADVRREIQFCQRIGLPILGVVENMAGFVCPKCSTETQIFKPSRTGGVQKLCSDLNLNLLGSMPLDPSLTLHPETPSPHFAPIYANIMSRLIELKQQ